ncbi:solute carrier family 2, facilitated glucose transporter member 9-like isoform X3 [Motacilla alba alba]|uniref:solute carrier family 2, facilitated glucose transporter member 9-like isoform X3 n=1 Tax=Motacilla alba alba TaxID=1094192 RepID=UPI0018D523FC|nr:solute carrier family 2, facilitated glucose transporter member 9-like isoform X3 [Motacilla alba alba]
MARWCCPAYGSRGHSGLEGTCESSQRWQSITSVVPPPPGWAVTPPRAEQSGGAAPAPGEGRGSRTPPPAAQAPPMSPGGARAALPCPAFPSLASSFFCLKMGETSRAAAPGLPSSPSPPPPPSPRSARSLTPPLGKGTPGPGGDITGHIKAFYNATWSQRYGHGLGPAPLTLLYALTVSIFALGGLVGSLLVGVLVERYGRNGALSRSALLVLLAGGFMGFSRELGSPEMVIIGRSITGIHSGICLSVVPLYLGEIAPKNLRGFLGLMPSIFICLGVFSAQVLGLPELLGKDRFWPLFLSVVVVPASLQLLLLHCFPESPRYLLIERNDVCGATKALHRFLGSPDVQDVIEEMKEEQRSLSSMEMASVWQLLRDRSVRWQTLSVAVVNAGMQLSGIDAIWFYTNTIFENAGIPVSQIPYTTMGTGAIEVVAGLIGCFTIERVGRRPLIITGFCAMGVCSAGITISLLLQAALPWMRYVSVACVVGIIAGFCMGPAGVPFLMTAELFMQSHRPAAYIVGGSLNWLCNFTVGFIFPFLQMSAGAFCYLVFCGVCLLVALYVYLVIPETKNKTFMEISHIFATRRSVLSVPAHLIGMMKLDGYGTLESSSLEGSGSSLP